MYFVKHSVMFTTLEPAHRRLVCGLTGIEKRVPHPFASLLGPKILAVADVIIDNHLQKPAVLKQKVPSFFQFTIIFNFNPILLKI